MTVKAGTPVLWRDCNLWLLRASWSPTSPRRAPAPPAISLHRRTTTTAFGNNTCGVAGALGTPPADVAVDLTNESLSRDHVDRDPQRRRIPRSSP